ncbi:hypothetical protein B0H66DRAFT_526384 [Apodospora peruviana]|uniref:Uncharacterized protein n=1 Tax=Apodospora peruviana TaxID=516989 RepID=A0AAE0IPL9_9PEZI|nr:hypothetical protein B0H66DRAFT_526384 [Apodospora peruviana]
MAGHPRQWVQLTKVEQYRLMFTFREGMYGFIADGQVTRPWVALRTERRRKKRVTEIDRFVVSWPAFPLGLISGLVYRSLEAGYLNYWQFSTPRPVSVVISVRLLDSLDVGCPWQASLKRKGEAVLGVGGGATLVAACS